MQVKDLVVPLISVARFTNASHANYDAVCTILVRVRWTLEYDQTQVIEVYHQISVMTTCSVPTIRCSKSI